MTVETGNTNSFYRDRLFKFIFGNENNKEWTLSLYNAVNGSNYENAADIEYNTIKDVLYMRMKNDVSFLIENTMSLYEHQTTLCPNMPLRFLMYLSKLYEGYSQKEKFYIYSSTLQHIPKPKCMCFYNGKTRTKDKQILRLSDMYFENTKSEIDIEGIVELEVIMLNINYGHNRELLEKCTPLYEYSFLVDKIRSHIDELEKDGENYTLENAIDLAIDELPKNFEILKFILSNRAEVKDMCLFEYNEEKHIRGEKEESREEGRKEGLVEGRKEGLVEGEKKGQLKLLSRLVSSGYISIEQAAKEVGMNVYDLKKIIETSQS